MAAAVKDAGDGARSSMRSAAGCRAFAQHGDGQDGTDQDDADQGKTVGVAHHRGLIPDGFTNRDNGAVHGAGRIGDTVRHEVLLQRVQTRPGGGLQQ